jgi:RNA-splicing ligase RtcB
MVWFMLHSGSRGVGNRMGSYFIELAKNDMKKFFGFVSIKYRHFSAIQPTAA